MEHSGGEHFQYAVPAPGTPAPRTGTVSRVVADGQSPTTVSNIARLASRGCPAFQPTSSLLPASYSATPDPSTCVYVPYRHVHTGERAMVPLRRDPVTGARIPLAPSPDGFQPTVDGLSSGPPDFLQWLAGLLCRHPAEPPVDSNAVRATAPIPPTRHRISPVDIRQLNFGDEPVDGALESASVLLSANHAMLAGGHPLDADKSVANCAF